MVVFVLLVVSVMQPLTPVFAAETRNEEVATNSINIVEEIAEEIPSESEEEVVVDETSVKENEAQKVLEVSGVNDVLAAEDGEAVNIEQENVVNTVATSTQTSATSTAEIDPELSITTSTSSSQNGTEVDTPAASDGNLDLDNQASSTATSTPVVPFVNTVTTAENFYQFSKDECVRVADGSYYCGAGGEKEAVLEDSFYVALDADGDTEIFARIEGETIQVTNNTVADAAPYYDRISNTLVWHQEVNDRYQIMSYDFDTEETTRLTSGRVNNMQPHRYDEITVWQQWGAEGWEIMMHDNDTVTALTNDVYPDISPTVREGYVMWRTQYADSQTVTIYDRTTGTSEVIDDIDPSLSLSNPRLMLVFEGIDREGVRVAKGFDPLTGKIMPLNTTPAPLPENIPNSEPTEEVRALVQPKPVSDDTLEVEDEDTPTTSSTTSVATDTQSTTTTDVIVPPLVTDTIPVASSSEETDVSMLEIDVPDLVIPPATSTEST